MSVKGTQNYVIYIDKILGSGSTGTVHFARHKRRGDPCAAKIFAAAQTSSTVRVKQNEIEFMRMLSHPNIVRFYAIEQETRSGDTVLLMELCTEGSLQKMLSQPEHVFGLRQALFISFFIQFVQGLSYLTLHGVVHRDVKPGNILCSSSDDGRLVFKLTDFGATREMSPHVGTQTLYGTEEYLYPETYRCVLIDKVALPGGIEDHAEMWSIGVTLYHVATGQLPFQALGGRTNRNTMYRIISTKPSGVISGVQTDGSGTIAWSRDFPDSCPLSRGARDHVVPIISSAVENDSSLQCKFDEFFPRCESFHQRLDVVVFDVVTAQFHHVFVSRQASLSELKREIGAQTGRPQSELIVVDRTLTIGSETETDTVGDLFPATSEEFPVVVSSASMATWRDVTRMKPTLPGKPSVTGGQTSLAGDVTWARDVTAYCYTVLLLIMQLCHAQNLFIRAKNTLLECLTERVNSLSTTISDISLTATTTVSSLRHVTRLAEQAPPTVTSSSSRDRRSRLRDVVGTLQRLETSLEAARTHVTKRQSRLRIPTTSHITSDGSSTQCQRERCAGRQEERYNRCLADYVQFMDDKRREQLSYNDEQIHKYRRLKLGELLSSVVNDVTQHCLRITDEQHQQLKYWHCDVFIKAYDDVRALDKSLQKLRGLLNEALSKLHEVNSMLKDLGGHSAEKPEQMSKSPTSSAHSTITSVSSSSTSSSPAAAATVSVAAVSHKSSTAHKQSMISPGKQSSRSATSAGTGAGTSTSSGGTTDAANVSSSSAELCESLVMTSSAAAVTFSQILHTQGEEIELMESIRHELSINNVDDYG